MPATAHKTTDNLPVVSWTPYEVQAWTPPEDLTVSQWGERKVVLGRDSEEQGPIRFSRTPYIVGIIDAVLLSHVSEIYFCKPAQIAGTKAAEIIVGYFVDQLPGPIMYCMSDEDTANYIAQERLQKMFENSPELFSLKGSTWNVREMSFANGAYISTAWASSVSKMGSKPARIVIADEIDKPGYYTKSKEASSLSLLKERKETFYNGKFIGFSTPTLDTGNIIAELESCDQILDFHVPCPHCGIEQPLRWNEEYAHGFKGGKYRAEDGEIRDLGRVVWEGGRSATPAQIEAAGYRCGACGETWTTVEKNLAVEKGRWIPREESGHKPRKIGFHINRLYSLLGKSGDIPKLVADFIAAVNAHDPRTLQGFVNSTLAEPWKQTVTKPEEAEILKARTELEPQTVPESAVVLAAFVDPSSYGFWFVVRAFAPDFTSWNIHYGLLQSWIQVGKLFFESQYPVADSDRHLRIWRAAIDIGGTKIEGKPASMTEQAIFWIRNNSGKGCPVWGTKGAARQMEAPIKLGPRRDKLASGKPVPGGYRVVSLDTDTLKDKFHYRLALAAKKDAGPMAAYLHSKTGKDYARQIMAEEKRIINGAETWVAVRRDNHWLDCETGCMALAEPEWEGGGVNLIAPPGKRQQKPKARRRKPVKRERW